MGFSKHRRNMTCETTTTKQCSESWDKNLCVGVTRTACKNLPKLQHLSWTHENWLNHESFRKLSTQCKTVPCQLTESKQWKMYIQILRQVSRMQWGISQDIFNTKYSLPQLDLITWFLLSWVSMLLFQLPLFKTVAAHRNCGVKLRDCFLLQNPPGSALCRGLLAPASWGSPPSPRRADHSSLPCNLKRPVSWPKATTAFQPVRTTGNPCFLFSMQFAYLELLITQSFFAPEWPNATPAGKDF